LCRAIVPYDEAPLGCAILNLGFRIAQGRTLSIVEIGSGPHLPKERFMECLESFAKHMKCTLETKITPQRQQIFQTPELKTVLTAFSKGSLSPRSPHQETTDKALSAVEEEDVETTEEVEKGNHRPITKALQDKPNKRSRVS